MVVQRGRWKSLRVARKCVARWVGVPWTKGQVPWLVVILGSVGDWHYEWKEFKASRLWPSRQFIRDSKLEWVTDESGAEGLDEAPGAPAVQFDVDVPGQGIKRRAQTGAVVWS